MDIDVALVGGSVVSSRGLYVVDDIDRFTLYLYIIIGIVFLVVGSCYILYIKSK